MPLPFTSPVPTAADWAAHRHALAVCRGTACYGALAAHFGTESSRELERKVDGREPYESDLGERSWSNKFHVWRRDGVLPGPDTVEHVGKITHGQVRLDYWRDLCLWKLLDPTMPTIEYLHGRLEALPARIRKILFFESEPTLMGRFIHSDIGREGALALRDLGTLDALLALLCLAREGEVLSDDPRHALPAMCAYDVLPRVLVAHPALSYRWEGLYACIDRVFWRRAYGGSGAVFEFSADKFRSNLEALRCNSFALLHQMAGGRRGKKERRGRAAA